MARKNKRTRNRRPKVSTRSKQLGPYAKMLVDPCSAVLRQGFHGTSEGILSALKTTTNPGSTFSSGYLLWDPTYAPDVPNGHVNCILWTNNSSGTNPTNTTADPFGTGATSSTVRGQSLIVGASNFATSSTVSDQRALSACVRLTYFGRMDASSGQVAYLDNVPAETLLDDGTGSPSSVDQLFNLSTKVQRLGVDPHEIRYRPPENASIFKTERDGILSLGTPTSSVTNLSSESLRFGPRLIGFAWRNVVATNELSFEFYQNIEWRPNTSTGFVSRVPRQIKSNGFMEDVLHTLDRTVPDWQTRATQVAGSALSAIAQYAWTGASAAIEASPAATPLLLGL